MSKMKIKNKEDLIERLKLVEELIPKPDELSVLISDDPAIAKEETEWWAGEVIERLAQRLQTAILAISVGRLELTIGKEVPIKLE